MLLCESLTKNLPLKMAECDPDFWSNCGPDFGTDDCRPEVNACGPDFGDDGCMPECSPTE